jgi:hypothetical protein
MDGERLLKFFLYTLGESEFYGDYSSTRQAYEYLDWAAEIFCRETLALRTSIQISTVLNQQDYPLPPDFIEMCARDRSGRFRAKYTDASDAPTWLYAVDQDEIYFADLTTAISAPPASFAIVAATSAANQITGTAISDSDESLGECVLYDTTKDFVAADKVYPRDAVYNLQSGSSGWVLEVMDANTLAVALFNSDHSIGNIAASDAYRISPASQSVLRINRPAGYDGHTIELQYHCLPLPVFAMSRSWRFAERACRAIVSGAVSIFKKPKKDYSGAAAIGGDFAAEIRRIKVEAATNILNRYGTRKPRGW